ncbi:hypothetical protein N7467_006105 [Penicillium canescens]|nr:hypothetical protein N7467_006105 [Penicillium canescens]
MNPINEHTPTNPNKQTVPSTANSPTTSPSTEHGRTSTTTLTTGSCSSRPGPGPGSSSTNLIPGPLRLKASSSSIPPIPPFSNELAASVPIPLPQRQGSTPELPDISFYRLRCELAPYSQSELINVPVDQRWRQKLNLNQNSRAMPRAWESASSIPLAYTRGGTSQSPGQSGSKNGNGSPVRPHAGRVITADGVILGANLDRYSSEMEVGRSSDRGRTVGRDCDEHVMSFMHYENGRRAERGGGGLGDGCGIEMWDTAHGRGRVNSASREGQRTQAATAIREDDLRTLDYDGDVPPAYDGKDGSSELDFKPLPGRMEMSVRT